MVDVVESNMAAAVPTSCDIAFVDKNILEAHNPKACHNNSYYCWCSSDTGHSYCIADLGNGQKHGPATGIKKYQPPLGSQPKPLF